VSPRTEESASTVTIATVTGHAPTPRIKLRCNTVRSSSATNACRIPAPPGRSSPYVAMKQGLRPGPGDKVNLRAANGEKMACEGAVTVNVWPGQEASGLPQGPGVFGLERGDPARLERDDGAGNPAEVIPLARYTR
jgi:hypothetical protein